MNLLLALALQLLTLSSWLHLSHNCEGGSYLRVWSSTCLWGVQFALFDHFFLPVRKKQIQQQLWEAAPPDREDFYFLTPYWTESVHHASGYHGQDEIPQWKHKVSPRQAGAREQGCWFLSFSSRFASFPKWGYKSVFRCSVFSDFEMLNLFPPLTEIPGSETALHLSVLLKVGCQGLVTGFPKVPG